MRSTARDKSRVCEVVTGLYRMWWVVILCVCAVFKFLNRLSLHSPPVNQSMNEHVMYFSPMYILDIPR